ncbi:TetR/AcrR family transcriptional regulator [Aliibacillus thermotolerans]|uniref:TetR/AcrR family transcriptional regulator n=1 Tax=Aliibacillus thermotolerans TaxID=1834418 RepID=A0ABW0U3U7_9BACI|nr:TetR/AcrR family transcriptional regulator [Aliibacillus thermotolerans]MDA3129396.1 TetR family transcriptional regulator [Aliibacillus thermotolerans]
MSKKQVPSMVKDEQLVKKRRAQMVKGAVSLFKQKGFHRTTTREIAKESGFSIGTLYEYIGSKEDVLYLVCDSIYDEVRERLEAHLSTDYSGLDRLKQVVRSLMKVMDEMQDEVLVMYQEAKSLPKDSLSYVLKKEMEMTAIVEKAIDSCRGDGLVDLTDKEVELLAHNIMIIAHAWTFRRWELQKRFTLEEYTDMQIRFLLHGMEENATKGGF